MYIQYMYIDIYLYLMCIYLYTYPRRRAPRGRGAPGDAHLLDGALQAAAGGDDNVECVNI